MKSTYKGSSMGGLYGVCGFRAVVTSENGRSVDISLPSVKCGFLLGNLEEAW